jgi:hypothetical protein
MPTIMRNVACAMLVAVAALRTGWPQSASEELSLSDIRAQHPPESIYSSNPCQQAREGSQGGMERFPVYPNTFVPDLKTLMERSDEVILAAHLDQYVVISPNGKSTARYEEVRVIHTWKGAHPAGATLTFGRRGGLVECSPNHGEFLFSAVPRGKFLNGLALDYFVYVLFLRHAQGEETQLAQGLLLSAGQGLQGEFQIYIPSTFPPSADGDRRCWGIEDGTANLEDCYSYLQSLTSPVMVLYEFDPLAAKYYGKPASGFIEEVQTEADRQESAQKPSLR